MVRNVYTILIDIIGVFLYNLYEENIMITLEKEKLLDGEWLYKYYFIDMGSARSIHKLIKLLNSQGKVNPNTGRAFTDMAAWFSLWTWAMNHPATSYEIFNKSMADEGKYYNTLEWDEFIQKKAKVIYKNNSRRLQKWQNRIQSENQINA